jgi:glycosyltransferase involved in cell wall biosynthesis|tara:strand:- start:31050 stop:32204 length:1155 start_codon:yes stop_codon:yes gene_type:complete
MDPATSMSESDQVKALRVLQVCHDYKGPFQGVCHQYNEAFPNSHVTTLYLQGPEDPSVVQATGGDRVLFLEQRAGSLKGLKLALLFRMARLFREHHYDIVIAHRYKAIYLTGILSCFFPIAVLLGVAHDHNVFKRRMRALFVTFWRRNIHLVAVSDSVRQDILRCCPSLEVQGRVHKLENAIDPGTADELLSSEEAKNELGIPQDRYCYGIVGRLVAWKNHDFLLTAYAEVASKGDCLVIVGAGTEYSRLVSRSRDLGIANNVIFAGKVHHARRIFRAFDTFLFVSGAREAFGVVLLEAMLAEVPVICSDASGPKEVIGGAGLLFEAGNVQALAQQMKIVRDLEPSKRQELQSRAKSRLFDEYTEQRLMQKLHALSVFKGYGDL